jgi:hypothetical protein
MPPKRWRWRFPHNLNFLAGAGAACPFQRPTKIEIRTHFKQAVKPHLPVIDAEIGKKWVGLCI